MKKKTIITIVLLVAVLALVVVFALPEKKPQRRIKSTNKTQTSQKLNPVFRKDGELSFIRDGQKTGTIDIEIADDDAERIQGLMYRDSLPGNSGMLFIFEEAEIQSFWMRNTLFSLDILYIDTAKKIVSMYENTEPLSLKSMPSGTEALYVLELTAGYAKANDIRIGDRITF